MNPEQLQRWEPVLQSQFAVSLLLLAALIGLLGLCIALYRENQQLQREFREHLRVQGDFSAVIDRGRELLELVGERGGDPHA